MTSEVRQYRSHLIIFFSLSLWTNIFGTLWCNIRHLNTPKLLAWKKHISIERANGEASAVPVPRSLSLLMQVPYMWVSEPSDESSYWKAHMAGESDTLSSVWIWPQNRYHSIVLAPQIHKDKHIISKTHYIETLLHQNKKTLIAYKKKIIG